MNCTEYIESRQSPVSKHVINHRNGRLGIGDEHQSSRDTEIRIQ